MFATSLGLLIGHLVAYILVPLIPGVITLHLLAGKHLRGAMFYLVSWFAGVAVVGYGLFLLQFVRFGVDRIAYIILTVVLLILLVVRMKSEGWKLRDLTPSRKIVLPIHDLKHDWKQRSSLSKVIVVVLSLLIIVFLVTSFIFVTHFPSYADDAFGNWHQPIMNILYDGGIKIFGEMGEILARARLGYPLMIPSFQAFISHVMGGYNDIYVNIFPWLAVFAFIGISKTFVYERTKDMLKALIGPAIIVSLPLIFMHTTQGYMDMLSAIYTAVAIIFFYQWLADGGHKHDFILGISFLCMLSYIKNDGFIVYMVGVLIALVIYGLIYREQSREYLKIFKRSSTWLFIVVLILFFIAPFTFVKSYYHLGFNQAAGADSGLGLASTIHREIFPAIWKTIWSMNNFSLAPLLMFFVALSLLVFRKKVAKEKWFLLLAPVVILGIFLAVFLFTENYLFVLNQTTSNRVFTMVLVIFFSFAVLLMEPESHHESI